MSHANIVKFIDSFEIDNSSFGTVLEYCEGPDLNTYLKKRKILSENEAKVILIQLLNGVKFMVIYLFFLKNIYLK